MQQHPNISAIIIDDEERSRSNLSILINDYCPEIHLKKTFGDVLKGLEYIQQEQPDLIFLDIQMPRLDGFKLVELLGDSWKPYIVFTTAHEDYAHRAFRVNAVDYLLKPIDVIELKNSVRKVSKAMANVQKEVYAPANSQHKKLIVPHKDGYSFINTSDIIYIEASRNYATIHTTQEVSILTSKPLKDLEEKLEPTLFFRSHRSFLVNIAHVKEFVKKDGGYLIMSNGKMVNLSKDKRDRFLNHLKTHHSS